MISSINNKIIKKTKSLKPGFYFYYDSESYLNLLKQIKKLKDTEAYQKYQIVNLDIYNAQYEIKNEDLNQIINKSKKQIFIWRLTLKNIIFWFHHFVFHPFNLVKGKH